MSESPQDLQEDRTAHAARLEIVERHAGERYGDDTPLCPNGIRINGVPVWCPEDKPLVVQEIDLSGKVGVPLVVTVRLQARALLIGEPPSRPAISAADVRNRFAVVELPAVADGPHPYAIVDGHRVRLASPPTIETVDVGSPHAADRVVVVTLPLVCRSVVFDDESTDQVPI